MKKTIQIEIPADDVTSSFWEFFTELEKAGFDMAGRITTWEDEEGEIRFFKQTVLDDGEE